MPVKGKQFVDNTIPQEKLDLIDPIDSDDAATKNYADNNRSVEIASISNKNMSGNDTLTAIQDFPVAVNEAITDVPAVGTKVDVIVNGEKVNIGAGLDGYFSPDGTTIRGRGDVEQGDILYWNKNGSKFNLDTTDLIDFNYMISVKSGA